MRFPWLQVDADFIGAHAGDLGAILGVSRREAMGLALDLWTWALARAKDDAPPDGIVTGTGPVPDRLLSGSVGWTGPAEQFTSALVAVGLAVRIDDGYRLTGFGRYRSTWEKNRRRSVGKPERNRSGTGAEPEPKTQTYTQKEATTFAAPAYAAPLASGGQAPLFDAPKPPAAKPEKPKKPKREPTGDSRHGPLIAALCSPELRYAFRGGHDAKAVSELLALADANPATRGEAAPAEVVRRWRICRAWVGFPHSRHLGDFATNWNSYADPQGGAKTAGGAIPAHLMRKAETHRAALLALPEGELPIPD